MKQTNEQRNSRSRKIGVGVGFALATIAVGSAIAVPNIIAYQNRPVSDNNAEWKSGAGGIGSGFYTDTVVANKTTSVICTATATDEHPIQNISLYSLGESGENNPTPILTLPIITVEGKELIEGEDYNIITIGDNAPYIRLNEPLSGKEKIEAKLKIDEEAFKEVESIQVIGRMWNDDSKESETEIKWMDSGVSGIKEESGWFTTNQFSFSSIDDRKVFGFITDGDLGHAISRIAVYDEGGNTVSFKPEVQIGDNILGIKAAGNNEWDLYKTIDGIQTVTLSIGVPQESVGKNLILRLYTPNSEPFIGGTTLNYSAKANSITDKVGYHNNETKKYIGGDTASFTCTASNDHPIQYFAVYDGNKTVAIDIEDVLKNGTSLSQEDWSLDKTTYICTLKDEINNGDKLIFNVKFKEATTENNCLACAWSDNDDLIAAWRTVKEKTGYFSELVWVDEVAGVTFNCIVNENGQIPNSFAFENDSATAIGGEVGGITINDNINDFGNWECKNNIWTRKEGVDPELKQDDVIKVHFNSTEQYGSECRLHMWNEESQSDVKMSKAYKPESQPDGYYSQNFIKRTGDSITFVCSPDSTLPLSKFALLDSKYGKVSGAKYGFKVEIDGVDDTNNWMASTDYTYFKRKSNAGPIASGTVSFTVTPSKSESVKAFGWNESEAKTVSTKYDESKSAWCNETAIKLSDGDLAVFTFNLDSDHSIQHFSLTNADDSSQLFDFEITKVLINGQEDSLDNWTKDPEPKYTRNIPISKGNNVQITIKFGENSSQNCNVICKGYIMSELSADDMRRAIKYSGKEGFWSNEMSLTAETQYTFKCSLDNSINKFALFTSDSTNPTFKVNEIKLQESDDSENWDIDAESGNTIITRNDKVDVGQLSFIVTPSQNCTVSACLWYEKPEPLGPYEMARKVSGLTDYTTEKGYISQVFDTTKASSITPVSCYCHTTYNDYPKDLYICTKGYGVHNISLDDIDSIYYTDKRGGYGPRTLLNKGTDYFLQESESKVCIRIDISKFSTDYCKLEVVVNLPKNLDCVIMWK